MRFVAVALRDGESAAALDAFDAATSRLGNGSGRCAPSGTGEPAVYVPPEFNRIEACTLQCQSTANRPFAGSAGEGDAQGAG